MAKLKFRYGTMASGKSLELLRVAFTYEENNLRTLILTSAIDDRYGQNIVKSRTGLSRDAIGLTKADNIVEIIQRSIDAEEQPYKCILVDEVQFLTPEHIYQLAEVVDTYGIPTICYGLRSDFKMEPFKASSVLMTIADDIEEIITICSKCCNRKASINAKFVDGNIVKVGKQIEIGGNDKYRPLCRECYTKLK